VPHRRAVADVRTTKYSSKPARSAGPSSSYASASWRTTSWPGTTLVDEAALRRIFSAWSVDVGSRSFPPPTLIAAGRRDSVAGYTDAVELLERYPRAMLAVVEDAGHALMHERPELLAVLLGDWLDRAR